MCSQKSFFTCELENNDRGLVQGLKQCFHRIFQCYVESKINKIYFEEKQKEQEEREHEIREQILQQRKQKFEEVTEKFQRAHIPLPQRRRAVSQKPVPPLEEALKQIQESNLKSKVNFPSSHRPTINLRFVLFALQLSLGRAESVAVRAPCALSCNGRKGENKNSVFHFTTLLSFQYEIGEDKTLKKQQHLRRLQDMLLEAFEFTNQQRLRTLDKEETRMTLEIGITTLRETQSYSFLPNTYGLLTVVLPTTHLGCEACYSNVFYKQHHQKHQITHIQNPYHKDNILDSSAYIHYPYDYQTSESTTFYLSHANASPCSPFPSSSTEKRRKANGVEKKIEKKELRDDNFKVERPKRKREKHTFNFVQIKIYLGIGDRVIGLSTSHETNLELRNYNATTIFILLAIGNALPSSLSKNDQKHLLSKINFFSIKEIYAIYECFNSKEQNPLLYQSLGHSRFSNSRNGYNFRPNKKQKITETPTLLSNVISNYDLVGQQKKRKYNIDGRSSVRFLKSILKKESKYEHDSFKALVINQGFKLRNQKAEAIRDSIELTKEKGGNAEIPKTIKKLRWVDETEYNHSLKNELEISQQRSQSFHTQTNSGVSNNIISVPACAVNSANRKKPKDDSISENLAASGGSRTNHVSLNCFIPSAFNIAKQAWPASEKEESKSPIHNSDSKTQKANIQRGREKVIRTKSAQVQSGFLYTNRKGTVIRAQSANKANTFLQAQDKLVVPHPPKTSPNIRSDKNIQVFQCQSEMPENSQNIITNNYFTSKHVLPAEHKVNQWNKVCSLPLSHVCSDSVPVMPSLPYCSECQTSAKTNHSNGTQIIAQQDGTLYCTQRCPVYEESHHSVAFRPTKEESVPSWKRRHNSLGQHEKAADSTIMRRKRIVENKQRNLLEQRKQNLGSVGQKCSEQMNNFGQRVKISSSEPKEATRDTSILKKVYSTSEFLMAENLVKSSVAEDDILSVMSKQQLQKPNLALNKTQQLDICALSAEEQKILQSLNRLNERLFYVQATICKNPSIKNTLQIMPFLCIYGSYLTLVRLYSSGSQPVGHDPQVENR
ncbi:hypothetical protein QTO34_004064 [Cnephaeus nilssonii]|uniref:Uncharacterized protein n=1 Tax=Cnephaeus nilssonii TaxID=3371016 RepID=A0AA40HS02_CNENI|nr:hypothetical protein QTO34_004064 [Eptesicus nilssonii]